MKSKLHVSPTGFGIGFGQVTIFIAGEILPSNARGFGSGAIAVLAGLVKFGVVSLVPLLQDLIGTGFVFLTCTGLTVILIIFTVVCVPETYGKTLEDIEQYFRDRSSTNVSNSKI